MKNQRFYWLSISLPMAEVVMILVVVHAEWNHLWRGLILFFFQFIMKTLWKRLAIKAKLIYAVVEIAPPPPTPTHPSVS